MNPRGAYEKRNANIENVEARYQWCLACLRDPSQLPDNCAAVLNSQGSFAALNLPGTHVRPIALNTLKAIADEILKRQAPDGKGFVYLDTLRLALKQKAGQRATARSGDSRQKRQSKSDQLLRTRFRLTEVLNLQRTQAYVDLFSKVVAFTQASSVHDTLRLRLHNLLTDHKELHSNLLSPAAAGALESSLRIIPGGKP